MLKIENVETDGWEAAIRGMRNPKNSWDRSDSGWCVNKKCTECDCYDEDICACYQHEEADGFIIGPNDKGLMMNLAKGGPVHAKYRRMITVWLDITAPLYWWKEFDTYKVGTVANSCSTMHKIHDKEFTLEDFSHDHLLPYPSIEVMNSVIVALNVARNCYLECQDSTAKKDWWWQMIQLLPSSYNQKRTICLNYEVLHHMYHDRRFHKLDEWHVVCDWIESLPYSEIMTQKVVGIE